MLHILWLIIKWILILLGILAGLILLLLLLLLFCPVRYKGKAAKERSAGIKEVEASGEVSWLFHGIAVRVFLRNGSPAMDFYIVGIPLCQSTVSLAYKRGPNLSVPTVALCLNPLSVSEEIRIQ